MISLSISFVLQKVITQRKFCKSNVKFNVLVEKTVVQMFLAFIEIAQKMTLETKYLRQVIRMYYFDLTIV